MNLSISPLGRLSVDPDSKEASSALSEEVSRRIREAFGRGSAHGLLHLATVELSTSLPGAFAFARTWGCAYLTQFCHRPEEPTHSWPAANLSMPTQEERIAVAQAAPPMRGAEYLTADMLATWWVELDALVRAEVERTGQSIQAFLSARNSLWRMVGRVTFHLAENKRDPAYPFAFLATYSGRLSSRGQLQHLPLERALREYGAARNRTALLSLLEPIQQASQRIPWVKEITESEDVYRALAWDPREAYRFLENIPELEASGLIVRVPDWWKAASPPRPVVNVKIGEGARSKLSAESLLDFEVSVALDGVPLSELEMRTILASAGGLVSLRGKWVELDQEKLTGALAHWKKVERESEGGGLSFFEGMRLLAGAHLGSELPAASVAVLDTARQWVGVTAGAWLEELLGKWRAAEGAVEPPPETLLATLRPYQQTGVHWLRFITRLGLGACLADDMGLGKTIQVIALLLHLKADSADRLRQAPSLLVVPASLIANWKTELARFAPSLSVSIVHPSEPGAGLTNPEAAAGCDLIVTTYAMLCRLDWLRQREWKLAILDEAQAIKNSGVRQTRAAKELRAQARIAMTGTPIENRLSDLWSLFDFLNPGLLGTSKAFSSFVKRQDADGQNAYASLRTLVRPYILRRLKTDGRVIADLPEKTEMRAYCGLTKYQAALYEQTVRALEQAINRTDGIERRGVVLASLMRLKQICNHPSQQTGDGVYAPEQSGKFGRLAEICRELHQRQEKALIFTQFREITEPLQEFLSVIFGRAGLVLHGQTPVGKRRQMIDAFQQEDGPPFFLLSLKAGGTGLNLTAASHVIHFDRWWNPAVENQATDRAFRIGQRRNVMVHKFVCRGTVEERIDAIIMEKTGLSGDLLEDRGAEALFTEMDNQQLLQMVALDIHKAMEG